MMVTLRCIGDDGVEYNWEFDTVEAETPTDAIDEALEWAHLTDEQVVGLVDVTEVAEELQR